MTIFIAITLIIWVFTAITVEINSMPSMWGNCGEFEDLPFIIRFLFIISNIVLLVCTFIEIIKILIEN